MEAPAPGGRVAPGVGGADTVVADVLLGVADGDDVEDSACPPVDWAQAATNAVIAITPAIRIQPG